MKYKTLLATLGILFTTSVFAGGDMGGGAAIHMNTLELPSSAVEAFIGNDGAYISMADIQGGFETIKGLKITPQKTLIDLSKSTKLNIESIILRSGQEFRLDMKSDGGDMGGG